MLRLLGVMLLFVCLATASDTPPGGKFNGCPVKGLKGDLTLNGLKNRTKQVSSPEIVTIDDILALPTPSVKTRILRSKWPPKDTQIVASSEKRAVQLEGFLDFVKHQGAEECNCSDTNETDFH